ncbi:MAG: NUDIX domain-containing protein [Sandaracinaceae bacterium]|nr:NUDIX domain-containing protein [Sandaracinaceae bacterium]
MRDSHCGFCGARFTTEAWPRTCGACGNVTYRNPIPVAVALVPVHATGAQVGLLVVRRDIEPKRGQLALPGGFIDFGESWQSAVARELFEETGVRIDPRGVREHMVRSTDNGRLVVFGLTVEIAEHDLAPFVRNDEVSERSIVRAPIELAFPTHTEAMRAFFERRAA